MRTIIDLTDEQLKALSALCHKEHISRAEAVRRAVNTLLADAHKPQDVDAAFGIWRHKKTDARKLVDRIRADWDRK